MATKRVITRRPRNPEPTPAEEVPARAPRDLVPALQRSISKLEGDLFDSRDPETIAVGIDGGLTKYGVSAFGLESGRHATMLFKPRYSGSRRLLCVKDFVHLYTRALENRYVVGEYLMEGYSFGSPGQQHKIGEGGAATKLGLIEAYSGQEKIAFPTIVSPNSLKKFILGKGSGKKQEVLLGVYRKWKIDFGGEDDMADAFGLARLGAALLSGHTDHKYEAEVVASLERNTEWEPQS